MGKLYIHNGNIEHFLSLLSFPVIIVILVIVLAVLEKKK